MGDARRALLRLSDTGRALHAELFPQVQPSTASSWTPCPSPSCRPWPAPLRASAPGKGIDVVELEFRRLRISEDRFVLDLTAVTDKHAPGSRSTLENFPMKALLLGLAARHLRKHHHGRTGHAVLGAIG